MPSFLQFAIVTAIGCAAFAFGIQVDIPGDGALDALVRVLLGVLAVAGTNAGLWWTARRLNIAPARMLVSSNVFLLCLLLLFLQNKALVGTQELQAEVSGDKTTYTVAFRDLAGSPVNAGESEKKQVVARLSNEAHGAAIKLEGEPVVTSDQKLTLTLKSAEDAQALRDRLVNKPFNRPNDPRSLFAVNQGIDLRGGVEFICQLYDDLGRRRAADDDVLHILRGRLDSRGLTEPTVTRLGNGDVQIVIPGGTAADGARTRKVIEQTGRLEFREVLALYRPGTDENGKWKLPDEVVRKPNGGFDLAPGVRGNRKQIVAVDKNRDPTALPTVFYHLGPAELTGKDVKDAGRTIHDGKDAVSITFTASGSTRNFEFTSRLHQDRLKNPGEPPTTGPRHGFMAILFDGKVESSPVVQEPSNTSCVISGSFTPEEIDSLKSALRGGSLSVTPVVLSERIVGATLGIETVNRAIGSMLWAFVGILVFMVFYYRRLGVVAMLCLLVTAALTWTTLSIFGATMTLPGLAGLVLSIAMSMDCNVLVYERIREELRDGKDLRTAIHEGYSRAFVAILDSNLTTIFSGIVLYWIGSGSVKGFGLTLAVGVAVSMFSGVYIGRLLTDLLCRGRDTVSMASVVKEIRLPYVSWRRASYLISFITGAAGILYFAVGHKLTEGGSFNRNFDIDFTGGNLTQVIFKEELSTAEVKETLAAAWKSDPKRFELLDPAELAPPQAYFSTGGGSKTRQWVFRGRDEVGAELEAQRAVLDAERGRLNRELEKARDPDKPDVAKVRELEPLARKKSDEIRVLEEQIARRVAVFKEQLAAAFPGRVAEEGSELLGATWKDKTLTLRLATLATPEASAVERVQKSLARREELASAQVAALAGATGIEIAVTYRQAPAAVGVESDGVTIAKLKELLAPTAGEATKDVAHAAQDIYTAALQQTAVAGITVAQAYPASQHFSGQVAGSMKLSALIAILLATVAMLAYIAARFELGFGIAAVVAMFHDVLLTLGIISLLHLRIDLTVVAALLTIIGYSVNDTIVTFDRIRENMKKKSGVALATIIDESIAQTMPRTVLTGGATILAIIFMMLFAGPDIFAFNATLLIGTILGTYSSVFVAAPMLLLFDRSKLESPEKPAEPAPGEAGDGQPEPA